MTSTRPIRPFQTPKDGQINQPPESKAKLTTSRVSTACEACKKKKTKCSGGPPPCELCQTLDTTCVIELWRDGRRREAFRRVADESESHSKSVNWLIDIIRTSPLPHLDMLFEHIRATESTQDAANFIRQYLSSVEEKHHQQDISEEERRIVPTHPTPDESSTCSSPVNPETSNIESFLEYISRTAKSPKVDLQGGSPQPYSGIDLLGTVRSTKQQSSVEPRVQYPISHILQNDTLSKTDFTEGLLREGLHSSFQFSSNNTQEQTKSGRHLTVYLEHPASPQSTGPLASFLEPATGSPLQVANDVEILVAQNSHSMQLRLPRHLILPFVVPDESPLSRIYTDYVEGARQMLKDGVSISDVLGSTEHVAVDLFFRPREASDKFDCSSWACEICRTDGSNDLVQLASAYLLTKMMQWRLVPTLENYQKVPDMMKPTPVQCAVPHIGAIETLPMPPLRDALIKELRDWHSPLFKTKWSVNWTHGTDAAITRDPASGKIVVSAAFTEHVTQFGNWSVGSDFLTLFPEVAGQIRIHDEE